jgi:plasmid stabilization system protein ParE
VNVTTFDLDVRRELFHIMPEHRSLVARFTDADGNDLSVHLHADRLERLDRVIDSLADARRILAEMPESGDACTGLDAA